MIAFHFTKKSFKTPNLSSKNSLLGINTKHRIFFHGRKYFFSHIQIQFFFRKSENALHGIFNRSFKYFKKFFKNHQHYFKLNSMLAKMHYSHVHCRYIRHVHVSNRNEQVKQHRVRPELRWVIFEDLRL